MSLKWALRGLAILSVFIAAYALYKMGYNKGLNKSEVAVQQYEKRVQELNANLARATEQVSVRVVTQYRDRVNTVDRVVYQNRDVIRTIVPEQFTLSKGWIYAYNQSILGQPIDQILAADKTPSSVSEMRALADTIAPNNGVCLANAEQLTALQNWLRDTENARAATTSN